MNKWILILSVLAGVSSQAGDLKIQTAPLMTYIAPVSRASCVQLHDIKFSPYEVKPNSFELGALALQWKGKNPMQLGSIVVDFKSPVLKGGNYQCVIEGAELEAIFELFGGHVATEPQTFYSGMCGVRCGSLEFIPEVEAASITGTMKVTGYELNAEGKFVPVTAKAPVTLRY